MLSFVKNPTRHLFFTGKGGVGKTSIACATAVALADAGRRVLLVSTDPASNLSDVMASPVDHRVAPVTGFTGLLAVNIDPERAAADYRERVVSPMRGVLPDEAVSSIEEQLSGACTTEIAAFDRFAAYLAGEADASTVDVVVFDTAPTGHTLRLLELPSAWSGFIESNPGGASCLGPVSALESQRGRYERAAAALRDGDSTTIVLVARPEPSALAEAARTSRELSELGVLNQRLVVNAVFEAEGSIDPVARALSDLGAEALASLPAALVPLPREMLALRPFQPLGPEALRAFLAQRGSSEPAAGDSNDPGDARTTAGPAPLGKRGFHPPLSTLIDRIEADSKGLVLVMGKGGVGKTTIAAAIAVSLADRGHAVHLTTTDPAAHLEATVGPSNDRLRITRIDPEAETARYIEHVMKTRGRDLDEEARRLLEEDLRSPCTEEVAVFHAFSRAVGDAARGFVVMDTAPTGHTLLLLDAAGSYHREVLQRIRIETGRVTTPLMRLRDAGFAKVLLVTLPETTPVREAAALQDDLRRAGIEPYAWIVNRSLALVDTADPLLARRAEAEWARINEVRERHAVRTWVLPFAIEPPIGTGRLGDLVDFVAQQTGNDPL